jgi:DNA uptake protein ComE-like DNA-binding protein
MPVSDNSAGAESKPGSPENRQIAERLREAAELLRAQGANPFRVGAYRKAADTVAQLSGSLRAILDSEGVKGLDALPNIGAGIASAIAEMLITTRWGQLERLRGTTDPERLFRSVPGMGPELAKRIHDTLHIDTLEGLETAANDGRLESVPGIGARRAAAWRAALDRMLGRLRAPRSRTPEDLSREPGVDVLLDVDREYRRKAEAGQLRTIAPRRFNPGKDSWLPVLHARRGEWHFTALYSNTALAHKLKRVRDWVVIYFYDSDHVERQRTVVTETRGSLAGRRVVRGREGECRGLYVESAAA